MFTPNFFQNLPTNAPYESTRSVRVPCLAHHATKHIYSNISFNGYTSLPSVMHKCKTLH